VPSSTSIPSECGAVFAAEHTVERIATCVRLNPAA